MENKIRNSGYVEYYIGIDMGTNSAGWAVTDLMYNIIRKKGKDMWGAELFKEAETAQARRKFRTSRRRNSRDVARRGILRELFADEVNKVDAGFFQRLDDSKYFPEDKTEEQRFALFANKNFTDKEYYQKYQTIFHLRKALIENTNEVFDVRLVYLAILNIFKHRGHFLNSNIDDAGNSLNEEIKKLDNLMQEFFEVKIFGDDENTSEIEKILTDKNYSNSSKAAGIAEKLNISSKNDKQKMEIIKLICGLKGNLPKIFTDDNLFDDENKNISISFRDGDFDEKIIEIENILPEEYYEILLAIKQVHDSGLLANILKNNKYLSCARVELYDKHNKDLHVLKRLIKSKIPDEYNKMFREINKDNYSSYVGSVNSDGKKKRRGAKCSDEDFFKNIKKILKEVEDCEDKNYVIEEIDKGNFLPKQLTAMNGVIPYQVHKKELKKILENAECYLDFLKEKDETGMSASEKILALFEFQIPYFVGPISFGENTDKYSKNIWSVRKEGGKVYPWNFEEKIDVKESAEKFIDRMVRRCTYISGQNVLPKNSLLYEKFMVLNELNNLKINEEKISVELKQKIYNELFRSGNRITEKKLKEYLKISGLCDSSEEVRISGIDGDFVNRLLNYSRFADDIFDTERLTVRQEKIAEDIIFWSTVYGESKSFLREKIIENYGNELDDKKIKKILGYKFKDWGNLSHELLKINGVDKSTGEIMTVIDRMWNENYNLSELLLSNKFTYKDEIKKLNNTCIKDIQEITYDDLDETYATAPVKRMVWQATLIIKEIIKIMGCEPKKIFIEMTRTNEEKKGMEGRKESRKSTLLSLYKNCRDKEYDWIDNIESRDEKDFRRKKLFLFYLQKGRCMYSGEIIDLKELFNDNLYDIDHIYPRHFVKDDSLMNNLVLVKKEINNHKSDTYPIEDAIRKNMYSMWKLLYEGGFINKEKYKRLTRNSEFTDKEKADFIARQIVETGQGTKILSKILENTLGSTEIVYVKAGNVSDFRHKFGLLKCREINNYHHAKDAYLNIVVGNVYNVKFTKNPINFISNEYSKDKNKYNYNLNRMFEYDVVRGDEVAWRVNESSSIKNVKKNMYRDTPIVTRMNYELHGGITNKQTLYGSDDVVKAKGKGYIPLKTSDEKLKDISKYGGFKDVAGAYFFVVEHTVKKKRVRTIEPMPIYLKDKYKDKADKEKYCIEVLKYENPSVRYNKIKMYSLIKVNGFYLYLTGRSNDRLIVLNGVELSMGMSSKNEMEINIIDYIRKLVKSYEKGYIMESVTSDNNVKIYDELVYIHNNTIFKNRPNSVGKILIDGRDKFINCKLEEQIYTILQILQLTHNVNTGADLKCIGGSSKTGVTMINKKISDNVEFKLINESVTGLFRKEVNLLTI